MSSTSRRWLAIRLVVTLGLVSELYGCSSLDAAGEGAASAKAAREISKGCDLVEESLKYEAFVGARALAVLSWTGMSEDARNLKIPVYVLGIEGGAITVRFLQFPMREQYLHIWLASGHITAAPESVFLLDPCSAALEPWPVAANARSTN